ncbi:alanine--glyoxylate transaminase [Balamuthia mandrillaris]
MRRALTFANPTAAAAATCSLRGSKLLLPSASACRSFSSSSLSMNQEQANASDSSRPTLMIPGPIEFSPKVLEAMAYPSMSHVSPEFIAIFQDSLKKLRQVFATKNGQPLVVAGSGTLGWDMAVCNLLSKDNSKALVVSTGLFSERFAKCIGNYGGHAHTLAVPVGQCPDLDKIANALKSHKGLRMVTVTHVDTSTGVLAPVKEIAQLVKKTSPDTLMVVDGVCATGAEELLMDEWGIDIVLTASQKAIGVPPGLSIMMLSEYATRVFRERITPVASYYCDWTKWLPIMKAYEAGTPDYFATPPVNLVRALQVSLNEILDEGMENRWQAHKKAGAAIRKAVKALGLELVAANENISANTISAIKFPQAVLDAKKGPTLLSIIKQKGKVELAGGLHPDIKPTYFRIGHMGYSVTKNKEHHHLEKAIAALEIGLSDKEIGHSFKPNIGVETLRHNM